MNKNNKKRGKIMLLPLLFAILLHECGHIVTLLFLGGKLSTVKPHFFGITIKAFYPTSYLRHAFVALAGPIFGIVGFLFFCTASGSFHFFAVISLFLSLFNLLPIHSLDGGEALQAILLSILPYEKATTVTRTVSLLFLIPLWGLSVYLLLFLNGSPSLFFLSLWLFLRQMNLSPSLVS